MKADRGQVGERVLDRVNGVTGLDPLTGHCPCCGTDGQYRHAKWCPLHPTRCATPTSEAEGE